jgi:hypothetical protein
MSALSEEEAEAVRSWLDRNQFELVSSSEGDESGLLGDRQDVWERDGTLLRLTRDHGQWHYDLSRTGANVWLDIDRVAASMGTTSTVPVDRVADIAPSMNDRVFGALSTALHHSPGTPSHPAEQG